MQINTRSDYRSILTLSFGFMLLNLDRWIIAPLFPVIQKDLGFNYQDLGAVVGVTALAWGLVSLIFGGLSDKLGRRKISKSRRRRHLPPPLRLKNLLDIPF